MEGTWVAVVLLKLDLKAGYYHIVLTLLNITVSFSHEKKGFFSHTTYIVHMYWKKRDVNHKFTWYR